MQCQPNMGHSHPKKLKSLCRSQSLSGWLQIQYERYAAQAVVAATAKTQLKKETEWMRRQPKARSTKSKTREAAFYELSKVARSGPKKDVKVNFGDGTMMRQVYA